MEFLFVQMGGTIDKDYPKTTKGWAFEIGESAIGPMLARLNPTFSYTITSVCKKDSQEINKADRNALLSIIDNASQEKIIITHGTDTMIETAQFLNGKTTKTVVLTGSMRPEKFKNSDADLNLGVAIGAVSQLDTGVYIAMNGIVSVADQSARDLSSGRFIIKH